MSKTEFLYKTLLHSFYQSKKSRNQPKHFIIYNLLIILVVVYILQLHSDETQ